MDIRNSKWESYAPSRRTAMLSTGRKTVQTMAATLIFALCCSAQQFAVKTHLSNDGTFSFQYPSDFNVDDSSKGSFKLISSSGYEEVGLLPRVTNISPSQGANQILNALHSRNPELRSSAVTGSATRADFQYTFTQNFVPYLGVGVVVKVSGLTIAWSYEVPTSKYSRQRVDALLRLIVYSSKWIQDPSATRASLPLGKWSTDISGSSSGLNSTMASSTSGETYEFLPNGKYRNVTMGFGALTGIATQTGDFTVQGDTLILHATAESNRTLSSQRGASRPMNEINKFRWYLEDPRTLVLIDVPNAARKHLYAMDK